MLIGESRIFFLITKGALSEEFFIGTSGETSGDVLQALRCSPDQVDKAKKEIAQHYIKRGEAIPVLTTVRIKLTAETA